MIKSLASGLLSVIKALWEIATAPNSFEVLVTKTIDGDSILGKDADGKTHKIRIRGADAPELRQPGGIEAKQETNTLLHGKVVTLLNPETDKFGRTAANVQTVDGIDAAENLTGKGLAWACQAHGQIKHALAEKRARKTKKGIWSPKQKPQPPWDFRKDHPNI